MRPTNLDHVEPITSHLLKLRDEDLYKRQGESSSELSAANFYVPSLPGLPTSSTLKLFAGHIPTHPASDADSDSHLFFLLARNRHIADKERFVIWLNGGPVRSCLDIISCLFTAQDPASFVGLVPLINLQGALYKAAMSTVDQPAGTGYSYVSTNKYVHELPIAADHVVDFLKRFYTVFPEFANMETYIAGESYAGQYIPYTANAILSTSEISPPLKGIIIGNGWISPYHQYPAYLPFALNAGVLTPGDPVTKTIENSARNCNSTMTGKGPNDVSIHVGQCEDILGKILESTVQTVNGQKLCINTYDIRLTDTHPSCGMNWPPDLSMLYEYLPREDIKNAFHASKKEGGWVECSGQVGGQFMAANSKPSVSLFPKLLESISILLFAGEQDLICNWYGISEMVNTIEWNGLTGFGKEKAKDWFVDGEHVGTWQSARNLTFVKIANASHMAPFDMPLVAHDMLLRFIDADLISAAGSAARVPSRIGSEQEAVIGTTSPNGTALTGDQTLELGSAVGSTQSAKATTDNSLTAYYNAGSAAILLLLLAAVAAIFFCLRAKLRKEMSLVPDLGLYEQANDGSLPGTPKRRRHKEHRRGLSSVSSHQSKAARTSSKLPRESHELDNLVARDGHAQDEKEEQQFALGDDGSDQEDIQEKEARESSLA